ncbi:hypothetical protein K501DRAFT_131570, partial [Backusella circina FSU 941]
LCCHYLDPILFHLFTDSEKRYILQWPNLKVNETGFKRSDAIVAEIVQQKLGCNVGYGEVKTDDAKKSDILLYRDIHRLGSFAKDTIDLYDLSIYISLQ